MVRKYRVGILGATGTVGQRFIQLLDGHPLFEVTALAASDRSQGKPYAEACAWRLSGEMPSGVRALEVAAPEPPLDCDLVFSSLPAGIAREIEESFARAGYPVLSNSSAFRMDRDVPLVIPEINHEHLSLIERQKRERGFDRGFIVTNPNCSTIMLALALAPLHQRFGVEASVVTTLQALSGAGYPGVPSLDICDNVLPFIEKEEEKIETETLKILGKLRGESIEEAPMKVSAQCHRVNVTDGHMAAIRVKLKRAASLEEITDALASWRSLPQELELHSAPSHPIIVRTEPDRPQPRLDRDAGGGMSVTVGRIKPDPIFDLRFVALSHNTIRGAAGAAILNAELLVALEYI
ncbi:aspartate-semialdehyde dehydrogenase [Pyrinomonas methylaliphatogenes]|jgi:aspartate-semialdehyde dehydrogenase|uniref:Aspartate-semialdehyde dehydrogenase n=1 Tax=Pyrinomonas methylaliphatogenes TaxID=454194 RepID=A0A0B6WYX7_9BACT|nr:aspartate-semialdehyde dehydrogenase [Pyrinomonas methylaliphatogenes]MBX5479263.1 aspartate-semialdehyde dehydrogenase [Pyrinomonas methylaliphatogenes]CDM65365.1 aspartate semialdehyde dehydrogenase [Pyrinomonas methylaliphatogenes]